MERFIANSETSSCKSTHRIPIHNEAPFPAPLPRFSPNLANLSLEFRLDSREHAQAERHAILLLEALRPRLLWIIKRTRRLAPPASGSPLSYVDALTTPFPVSEQIGLFAMIAMDNLRAFYMHIKRTEELPPTALYSLIRTAVEPSSLGQWVLDAKGTQKRAGRSLRITRANVSSFGTLGGAFASGGERQQLVFEGIVANLFAALTGVDQDSFEHAVKSTDVLQQVDADHGPSHVGYSRTQVWRATSGMLHANSLAFSFLLERHPDGEVGQPATRTSRVSLITAFYQVAIEAVEQLLDTYDRESLAPAHLRR